MAKNKQGEGHDQLEELDKVISGSFDIKSTQKPKGKILLNSNILQRLLNESVHDRTSNKSLDSLEAQPT